ncbi:DUF47 domain-containing protein [Marinicrinis lubricantis]|uniref:DUF47 domain-containing protein n=1 Tax=Marinicrinis lubricantis TaxID=2086470 RepID=A0ABW1ILX1_9BACL
MLFFGRKNDDEFLNLLLQSAENTLKGAQMFRTALMGEKEPNAYVASIKELESKGDDITHQIFKRLNQVFLTPLDREDIMELAVKVDDVIDGIEATMARFEYLNVSASDDYMKGFTEILVSSCEHILEAFKLLSKKKYMQIHEHTVVINDLENQADKLMRDGIREIFSDPKDPYTDFKLKEIYERLEETTDACEDVADILESVVLRYG